jgi:hypothetical protein
MVVMKRVTVLGIVVIALVISAVASAARAPLSAAQSSYLNFALTPSQTVPMVNGWTGELLSPSPLMTPDMQGFASFKLVDPEEGIAHFQIWVTKLPPIQNEELLAGLYWGQPGQNGSYVTGLATSQRQNGILMTGTLDWSILVWDIFSHPGNYYVQLVDMQHPGPYGVPLLRGQMDNGFGLYLH